MILWLKKNNNCGLYFLSLLNPIICVNIPLLDKRLSFACPSGCWAQTTPLDSDTVGNEDLGPIQVGMRGSSQSASSHSLVAGLFCIMQ